MPNLMKTMIQQTGRHAGGWQHAHGLSPVPTMHPHGLVPAGPAMHPDGLVPSGLTATGNSFRGRGANMKRGGQKAPPPIAMPKPSGPNWGNAMNHSPMSGRAMAGGVGIAAAVGGMAGGVYANRDGFSFSGSVKGALGGAIAGAAMGIGMPHAATSGGKFLAQNKRFMSTAGSYSSNMVKMTRSLNSEGARTAMFAGGGLLGGMAFGGSDSKKRGFNRNRGSSIGH